MIPRVDVLDTYLARSMAEVKEMIEDLPKEQAHEWEELNALYWSCDDMMYVPPQVNTALELLALAGYEA